VAGDSKPLLRGVVVHRSPLVAADIGWRGPIPVTRPARTLLDLAGVAPRLVEGALDDAVVRGLTTLGAVGRMLDRTGGNGRTGTSLLRELVAARSAGQAPTESPLEDRLVDLLRRQGLPEPVRQHEVTVPDGGVVRLDLAYPHVKVGIEADGRVWHSGRADFTRDRQRANRLAHAGWTLLRYGWADLQRAGAVGDEVAGLLARKAG
jgi:very-short-patch-repair endonuclease